MMSFLMSVLAAVPDPGQGTAPPGAESFTKILGWAAYLALGLSVLGVLVAGAMMGISSQRGQGGGEHMSRLGWVMAGAIVIGSAAGLVRAVV